MLRAHKIRLNPNNKQRTYFARSAGVARVAYNWALNMWQVQYEAGEKPSESKLRKELNAIKKVEFPWMSEVTKNAPQQAIKDLGSAFKHFFRRVKAGEKPGYPRFKKKGINDSFRADNGCNDVKVNGRRVRLPKIGWIRMTEELRFSGRIMSATVSLTAGNWFVSLLVKTEDIVHDRTGSGKVGVDLGIKTLAVTSDAVEYPSPLPLRKKLKTLARLQRRVSRKKKGSSNRKKAISKVARLHARISDIRNDASHKMTTELILNNSLVGIEDLNVSGMIKNRRLSRAISEQGFSEIRRQLEYKATIYDSQVVVIGRFFPSSKLCYQCKTLHNMPLSARTMDCSCGWKVDRDLNAAMNILSEALGEGARMGRTPMEITALACKISQVKLCQRSRKKTSDLSRLV